MDGRDQQPQRQWGRATVFDQASTAQGLVIARIIAECQSDDDTAISGHTLDSILGREPTSTEYEAASALLRKKWGEWLAHPGESPFRPLGRFVALPSPGIPSASTSTQAQVSAQI